MRALPRRRRRPLRARPPVAVLALVVAGLAACGPAGGPGEERREVADTLPWSDDGGWSSLVAADLGEKLGGCAVGDVDPTKPGNEIVAVGVSGTVYVVSFVDGAWQHEVAGKASGEMVQVVVGDVDPNPEHPALEIVCVGVAEGTEDDGGQGAAHVLFFDEGEWVMREIHRSPALLHAAYVADGVGDRPDLDGTLGTEVVLGGFDDDLVVLDLTEDGWVPEVVGTLPGAAKNMVEYRDGVAVACADGSLLLLRRPSDTWQLELLDRAPAGNARMATDGARLLVARDDGGLGLYTGGVRKDIHRESDKLRGAVLANVDPPHPGVEAVTGGYGKTITVLTQDGDDWDDTEVYEDGDRLHHMAAGHLSNLGSSIFVVACGYSGRIIVLRRTPGA